VRIPAIAYSVFLMGILSFEVSTKVSSRDEGVIQVESLQYQTYTRAPEALVHKEERSLGLLTRQSQYIAIRCQIDIDMHSKTRLIAQSSLH